MGQGGASWGAESVHAAWEFLQAGRRRVGRFCHLLMPPDAHLDEAGQLEHKGGARGDAGAVQRQAVQAAAQAGGQGRHRFRAAETLARRLARKRSSGSKHAAAAAAADQQWQCSRAAGSPPLAHPLPDEGRHLFAILVPAPAAGVAVQGRGGDDCNVCVWCGVGAGRGSH